MTVRFAQFGRWIYRHFLVIGFLLPLSLIGPIWIYFRLASLTRTPRTELELVWFAVGVALGGGIFNLVPICVYKSLSRSRLLVLSAVEPDLADPRVMGVIGAGVALFGATAALHTLVLLDVFVSQPATMSRYAIGDLAIMVLEFGVTAIGYLVGWVSGSFVIVTRRWRRQRDWRRRRAA